MLSGFTSLGKTGLRTAFFAGGMTVYLIADPADPLAPFMHALLWKAVPTLIVCGIIGLILGDLRKHAERWIEHSVRQLFGKSAQPESPTHPQSSRSSIADAPHCPTCHATMVPRKRKRGTPAGERFWGCPAYPACRGTRPVRASAVAR